MMIVLDASASISLVLKSEKAEKIQKVVLESDKVLVPDLYMSEVANALWKYVQFENMGLDIIEKALQIALQLPDHCVETKDMIQEIFATSCQYKATVYDMTYVILARRYNASLLTLDKKLQTIAIKAGVKTLQI